MSRNFGIVTSRSASGAQPLPGSHIAHDTQRETIVRLSDHYSSRDDRSNLGAASQPATFLPAGSALESSEISETTRNIVSAVWVGLFLSCVAIFLGVFAYMLWRFL